jgi:hypothetical protein
VLLQAVAILALLNHIHGKGGICNRCVPTPTPTTITTPTTTTRTQTKTTQKQ